MNKQKLQEIAGIVSEGQEFSDCGAMLRSVLRDIKTILDNSDHDEDPYYTIEDLQDLYLRYAKASVKARRNGQTAERFS